MKIYLHGKIIFPAAPAKGDVLSYRDRPSSDHGGEISIYGGVVSDQTHRYTP